MLNSFLDKYIFTGTLKYAHNNFFLMGIPFAMVPSSLLASLAQKQDAKLDKEVYYSFKASMADSLSKQFGVNFKVDGRQAVDLVAALFSAFGWGEFEVIDLDSGNQRAIVRVKNSPIAAGVSGQAKFACDHFLRGIIAGMLGSFFDRDVECVETECSAINMVACEFVVKKKADFDFSKESTRRQLDTDR